MQEGIFVIHQLFARGILVMKKIKKKKTKPTFIISTFKTDKIKVGLVFLISNFFIAKTSLASNWRSFSSSYSALAPFHVIISTYNKFEFLRPFSKRYLVFSDHVLLWTSWTETKSLLIIPCNVLLLQNIKPKFKWWSWFLKT